MNKLKGKIVAIESSEAMSIVELDVKGDIFSAIVLETPQSADYLCVGQEIFLLFKETEVSIAENLSGLISLRNRIKSPIKNIDSQGILTKIILDYKGDDVVAIISSRSAKKLSLKNSEEVEWLVKATEVSLAQDLS